MERKYIFGPVNSRRLGISLGVDLVPDKTCTLNCVYCECGATSDLTKRIKEYVPTKDVIRELREYLSSGPQLDAVTFSGSGEPTLHSGIGRIIDFIKDNFPGYRVAVLTNGTLLWKKSVRRSLSSADIVIPSLDAVSDGVFDRILRPAKGITAGKVIDGLIRFAREFRGEIIIEIFIVPGLNDGEAELGRIREVCLAVGPRRIQLNKLDRPGAEPWVKSAEREDLLRIADFFKPLEVEIVGDPSAGARKNGQGDDPEQLILSTISRRPCTLDDLAVLTGKKKDEIAAIIEGFERRGIIIREKQDRGIFYKVSDRG